MPAERPLNPNQSLFVDYLLAEEKLDATAAYRKAYGANLSGASVSAAKLMRDPRIQARVAAAMEKRAAAAGMTAGEILTELRNVVTADPRDLMEFRRGACRYCHGLGFQFQRTPAEYRRDVDAYRKEQEALAKQGRPSDPLCAAFDPQGGIGYNRTAAAHPACPECFGEGEGYSYPKDSRTLTPAAARLFAGVKQTKDGLEIKTRSTDKSVELLMRHGGMLGDKDPDKGVTAEDKAAEVRALVGAMGAVVGRS